MSGGGSTTAIVDKGLLIPCCYCTINCGALSAAAALLGGRFVSSGCVSVGNYKYNLTGYVAVFKLKQKLCCRV